MKKGRLKEDVPGRFYFEKNSKSSTSNWRSETNVHILAGYVLSLVFYKMPDKGSSGSYLCTKAHNNLHVSS